MERLKELMKNIQDYYQYDGTPIKCIKCDSKNLKDEILAIVDIYQGMGPTSELEVKCLECGEIVGY